MGVKIIGDQTASKPTLTINKTGANSCNIGCSGSTSLNFTGESSTSTTMSGAVIVTNKCPFTVRIKYYKTDTTIVPDAIKVVGDSSASSNDFSVSVTGTLQTVRGCSFNKLSDKRRVA